MKLRICIVFRIWLMSEAAELLLNEIGNSILETHPDNQYNPKQQTTQYSNEVYKNLVLLSSVLV